MIKKWNIFRSHKCLRFMACLYCPTCISWKWRTVSDFLFVVELIQCAMLAELSCTTTITCFNFSLFFPRTLPTNPTPSWQRSPAAAAPSAPAPLFHGGLALHGRQFRFRARRVTFTCVWDHPSVLPSTSACLYSTIPKCGSIVSVNLVNCWDHSSHGTAGERHMRYHYDDVLTEFKGSLYLNVSQILGFVRTFEQTFQSWECFQLLCYKICTPQLQP